MQSADDSRAICTDYLPPQSWILLVDPERISEEGKNYLQRVEKPADFHSVAAVLAECSRFAVATTAEIQAGTAGVHCHLPFESVERFSGDIGRVRDELDTIAHGDEVFIVSPTEAEVERLREILAATKLAATGRLHYPIGTLHAGFRLRPAVGDTPCAVQTIAAHGVCLLLDAALLILTASELFHRGELRRLPRRRLGKAIDSFLDLREGDLVVHLAHGIGRYRGLQLIEKQGQHEEHLEIEFDGGTKIYVPAIKIDLVQKYVGGTKTRPTLAKIGGKIVAASRRRRPKAPSSTWPSKCWRCRPCARPGPASPSIPTATGSASSTRRFPIAKRPTSSPRSRRSRATCIAPRPMDRLLCGDVGFGKTEVAMRAAFKAVDNGYQVAVLVPTTILAEQHFHSFGERMAEFPFDIAKLSRFCTPRGRARRRSTGLKSGKVDIVIGTHRLASKDVEFHNLGLVIIDEEQRFGVDVKERLKALRATVDVLTLSATPIPRTLHMSLVGLRDISNLETPPEDRLAVETQGHPLGRRADPPRDPARAGPRRADLLRPQPRQRHRADRQPPAARSCPMLRLRIGHAQMPDDELEAGDGRFRRPQVRPAAGDDDRRKRPRHSQRQHDLHRRSRPLRPGRSAPAPRPRRPLQAPGLLLSARSSRTSTSRPTPPAGCGRSRSSARWAPASPSPCATWKSAARATCSARSKAGTSRPSATSCIASCWKTPSARCKSMPPKVALEVDINLPGDAFLPRRLRARHAAEDRPLSPADAGQHATTSWTISAPSWSIASASRRAPVERLLDADRAEDGRGSSGKSRRFTSRSEFVVFRYDDRQRIEQLVRQHKGKLRMVDEQERLSAAAARPYGQGPHLADRQIGVAAAAVGHYYPGPKCGSSLHVHSTAIV